MPLQFLFVDDHEGDVPIEEFEALRGHELIRVGPDAVTPEMVEGAAVILVDFVIDDWRNDELEDGRCAAALLPANGLALLSTLRSLVERADLNRKRDPKAFALLTGEPGKLSPLRGSQREHAIARLRDVEWIFEKPATREGWASLGGRINALGFAVAQLPDKWPSESEPLKAAVTALVALDFKESWADSAWDELLTARAPIHELSDATNGNVFLRWLLQRSLPYPGLFWDETYLAARLRTTCAALQSAMKGNKEFTDRLATCQYKGILADFDGRRWWRRGVEALIWELTDGRPYSVEALSHLVPPFEGNTDRELVVCLEASFNPDSSRLYIADDVVRVLPDDWPPFADQAYMTLESVRSDAALASIVVPEDRLMLE